MIRSAGSPEANRSISARWSMDNFPLADLERDLLYVANFMVTTVLMIKGINSVRHKPKRFLIYGYTASQAWREQKLLMNSRVLLIRYELLAILGDYSRFMGVIREELVEIKEKFATPRRTVITDEHWILMILISFRMTPLSSQNLTTDT